MKIISKIAASIAFASVSLGALPALADIVHERYARQDMRIEHGIRSGALTWREARQLRAEQRGIRQMIRRAQRDGHISPRERQLILRAQNQASRHIFAEKHDRQNRWTRWQRGSRWGGGYGLGRY